MTAYEITNEQKKYAWSLVSRCNYGRRGDFDGTKERQYTGILGEVLFADLCDLTRPQESTEQDGGIDFIIHGKHIDLKTMGRTVDVKPYFTNNLICSQVEQGDTHVYVFASINKTTSTFQVAGWIKKWDIRRVATICQKGKERTRADGTTFETQKEMFEINNRQLEPWQSPQVFLTAMIMFGI